MTLSKAEEVIGKLCCWLEEEPCEKRRAVEITGGAREMSAALIAAAQRTPSRILYLKHETDSSIPLFGTEQIMALTWLQGNRLPGQG